MTAPGIDHIARTVPDLGAPAERFTSEVHLRHFGLRADDVNRDHERGVEVQLVRGDERA